MSSQEDKKFLFLTSDDNKNQTTSEEQTATEKAENLFPRQEGEIPVKRLNDVDSKIFEDSAYNAVEDISLKLELKMLQMNKELDLINEQIELLNIVNPENKEQKITEFCEQIQKKKKYIIRSEKRIQKSWNSLQNQRYNVFNNRINGTKSQKNQRNYIKYRTGKQINCSCSIFEDPFISCKNNGQTGENL